MSTPPHRESSPFGEGRSGSRLARVTVSSQAGLCRRWCVVALLVALVAVAAGARASDARAAACGLPDVAPLWIEFSDGSVDFRLDVFGRPGVIAASKGVPVSLALRERGAQTVYWEMKLPRFAGRPRAPIGDPEALRIAADQLFDAAVAASGCATPLIALNELAGARASVLWSPEVAQYRADLLVFLERLAARGARPFLLTPAGSLVGAPVEIAGEAGDWWRAVAQYADIVLEVYFTAPDLVAQGPLLASRTMRIAFRYEAERLLRLGIPPSRIGLILGFQTRLGVFGREGLQPTESWLEVVKLHALAAREVASELGLATVWSWGWGTFGPESTDADKPAAACVYLWARDQGLCDGPSVAGSGFNASLTEGQIILPDRVECATPAGTLNAAAVERHLRVIGDRSSATRLLLARLVASKQAAVRWRRILAAERSIIDREFAGRRRHYRRELRRLGIALPVARNLIADQLRRRAILESIDVAPPTRRELRAYYREHANERTRRVIVNPAPSWLGGLEQGHAIAASAPERIFEGRKGRRLKLRTSEGTFVVRVIGRPKPLRRLKLGRVRQQLVRFLTQQATHEAVDNAAVKAEQAAIDGAICRRDQLPSANSPDPAAIPAVLRLR